MLCLQIYPNIEKCLAHNSFLWSGYLLSKSYLELHFSSFNPLNGFYEVDDVMLPLSLFSTETTAAFLEMSSVGLISILEWQ